ncbi:MAG: hypothetical protein NDJ90_04415 [Oligoflexia bacterium]|nr:hypothetical protein [Oligoflexia bacterium]
MLRSLARIAFKALPEELRLAWLRRNLRIPPLPPGAFSFRAARTPEEQDEAARLLHDCYVQAGLMAPDPAGRRRSPFDETPGAIRLIALSQLPASSPARPQLAGTVTLIPDSSAGLPSDSIFRKENDLLRRTGGRLLEASALAVPPPFRANRNQITLYLAKYLYHHATRHLGADLLCATIHPRAYDFYAGLMGFECNGREVAYPFVNGAKAIHISVDLPLAAARLRDGYFTSPDPYRNFSLFLGLEEPCFD